MLRLLRTHAPLLPPTSQQREEKDGKRGWEDGEDPNEAMDWALIAADALEVAEAIGTFPSLILLCFSFSPNLILA